MTFDAGGTPYVGYRDYDRNERATVQKFDGSNWVNVGPPAFSAGKAYETRMAIGANNVPYIAYCDEANSNKITVQKFDGGNWINVGAPGFSTGAVMTISIAVDGNNIPFVAYIDKTNGYKAFVQKFDGTAWVAAGSTDVGLVVQTQQWNVPAGCSFLAINMNGLANGVYFLNIRSKLVNKQIRLVKQ